MIKGAVFDMDGTILDSMKIWDEAGSRYLSGLGKKAEDDLNKKLFPMTVEEAAEYLIAEYDLTFDKEKVQQGILDTVGDFYRYEAACRPGAEKMLRTLRSAGIPAVVATTSHRDHIVSAFERLGIMKYFDRIFTCSEVRASKFEPDIFNAAAGYMGTEKEYTYVFEDGLYAVRTAARAGFRTVGIYDASSAEDWEDMKKEADHTMNDLTEFEHIWKSING